jgi:hypothetical protein
MSMYRNTNATKLQVTGDRWRLHGASLFALVVGLAANAAPAVAQTATPSVQEQIDNLQRQLDALKAQQQPAPGQQPPAASASTRTQAAPSARGTIRVGAVNLTFGGFIEAAGLYRSRNEVSDIASDFNTGLFFKNVVQTHEQEFRGTARQSRVSGLVSGDIDADTHVAGYIESDFLSSGTNSNSRESNSFVPRLRHGYTQLDFDNLGFHVLAGQSWSLLTTNTVGIIPRSEQIPLTIDAQYVPGFNWTRNPQARFVENFGGGLWAGVSFEEPQGVLAPGFPSPGTGLAVNSPNANNNGDSAGLLNNTTQFTNDFIPDVVGKVAFDPGFGHYELKGIGRMFTDRDLGTTHEVVGYGIGGAATVPVVPRLLDFQLSGLAGRGIGRYGSGQLPDVALSANGVSLVPIPVVQGLVGLIAHPMPGLDFYTYGGWEHADRAPGGARSAAGGYGFGGLINTGCNTEQSTAVAPTVNSAGTIVCQGQTENIVQITPGFWQDLFKGPFGRVVLGAQYSYTRRIGFNGVGGAPSVAENIAMISFRYYPF